MNVEDEDIDASDTIEMKEEESTTVQLGEARNPAGENSHADAKLSGVSYQVAPEWHPDSAQSSISVQIIDQTTNIEEGKGAVNLNYSVNSFLRVENNCTSEVSDTAVQIQQYDQNDVVPGSVTQLYLRFKHLIEHKRRPLQPVTSYLQEFEDNVLFLESEEFTVDRTLLGFFMLIGCDLAESKAQTLIPQIKYSPQDSDDIYAQIYNALLNSISEDDVKSGNLEKQKIENCDNEVETLKEIKVVTDTKDNFTIEDATKCVMKAATSLSEATNAIQTSFNEILGSLDIANNTQENAIQDRKILMEKLHQPMSRASESVKEASSALSKLMLMWKDRTGDRYRMSLKKDSDSEFVMKIEPDVEYSCHPSSYTQTEEKTSSNKEDETVYLSKDKTRKKLKRLRKMRQGGKLKRKLRKVSADNLDKDPGKKEHPCEECEYVAGDFYRLRRHMNSVHLGIKFPCDQCDFAASDSSGLSRHKKSKHEGHRYLCDQCEYAATTSSDLKRHKNSRHEGIRHPCDECDYSATQASNLTQHKKSKHRGVRYLCDQCPYAATAPSDLTRHKKCKHQSVFQCDKCDFVINNALKLKHHKKRQHEGYSCEQCDFTTPIRNNLRYHKRSKHDGSKYLCDQCEYSTINSSNLIRHKRSNHAVEVDKKSAVKRKEAALDEKTGLIYDPEGSVVEAASLQEVKPAGLAVHYPLAARQMEIKETIHIQGGGAQTFHSHPQNRSTSTDQDDKTISMSYSGSHRRDADSKLGVSFSSVQQPPAPSLAVTRDLDGLYRTRRELADREGGGYPASAPERDDNKDGGAAVTSGMNHFFSKQYNYIQ